MSAEAARGGSFITVKVRGDGGGGGGSFIVVKVRGGGDGGGGGGEQSHAVIGVVGGAKAAIS